MLRLIETLRHFFGREAPQPLADPLLHGGLNIAGQHELDYAELLDREWAEKFREYPWPPGWSS